MASMSEHMRSHYYGLLFLDLFFHHTFQFHAVFVGFVTATKEEMQRKRVSKRAPIPRINASDVEDANDDEVAAARKNARQVI